MHCLFTSDLHGNPDRYRHLLQVLQQERPDALLIGGDLFSQHTSAVELLHDLFYPGLRALRQTEGRRTRVLTILGNDDPRALEPLILEGAAEGLLEYIPTRTVALGPYRVCGYPFVPPTPFLLKDWERYDVSRYTPPGCVSPEEGRRSVPVDEHIVKYATIAEDLRELLRAGDPVHTIFLFHSPPHETALDRAALDGKWVDHVPMDVHVGSIAIKRFIEEHHPHVTLHGHIHEAPRLTGRWKEILGTTVAMSGCHDGPELALVRFDPDRPRAAVRELV